MVQNSFIQKVFLVVFFGFCAAGLIEFYKKMIWQANQDINGGYEKPGETVKRAVR